MSKPDPVHNPSGEFSSMVQHSYAIETIDSIKVFHWLYTVPGDF